MLYAPDYCPASIRKSKVEELTHSYPAFLDNFQTNDKMKPVNIRKILR